MAFFQNSVVQKYIKTLNEAEVTQAYQKFTSHFHNPTIQQNIREAKEEQYQEGFMRELFVDVLGYTLNPQPNYNLTTEIKNEKGSKKADGAVLLATDGEKEILISIDTSLHETTVEHFKTNTQQKLIVLEQP